MSDPVQRRLLEDLNGMENLKAQANEMMDFEVDSSLRNYTVKLKGIEGLKGTSAENIKKSSDFTFTVALEGNYPNAKPLIVFKEPLYHPNCYTGGRLCTDWIPSMGLSSLIIDIARMINLEIANPNSPANSDASNWYANNKQRIRELMKKSNFPPTPKDMMTFYQEDELVFL